jgi:hypothetical protein
MGRFSEFIGFDGIVRSFSPKKAFPRCFFSWELVSVSETILTKDGVSLYVSGKKG